MSIQSREAVLDPDVWHRPATYWFWHHLPDEAEIRAQVRRMRDAGFGGFQIQSRLSFPQSQYLDEQYLAACRIAVEAAGELAMVVGIYDDYNWQTGHAAGRAVAGHDDLRERQLFWTEIDLGSGEGVVSGIRSATENLGPSAMQWHYEGGEVRWTAWRLEHVVLERADGSLLDVAELASLTGDSDGAAVSLPPAALEAVARATAFVSARCSTSRLVNPLDRTAVERFVQAGLEPFRAAFGDHFGGTVQYVFFDQPHAVYYDWQQRTGQLRTAMPWHDSITTLLREAFGDRVPEALLAVLHAQATDDLALRAQFFDRFSAFAMQVFLGTLRDWAHEHGLLQSGHEVLSHVGSWLPGSAFDNWDLRVNFGLDHFGVDAYRDLTAVDAQDAVAQLSPKLGDAVARSNGRTGTMVEQYFMTPPEGGAPWSGHWGLTLQELRATAIRHHLQGMRQMVFHGFYQTDGHGCDTASLTNPRFDFPPGVNFEPWFDDHHPDYAVESSRLSAFLDDVRHEPRVAVLWPLRTIWIDGPASAASAQFASWCEALTASDVEFDIVDERDLLGQTGRAADHELLVLPGVRALRSAETLAALRGRRVLASGATPQVYQDGAQTAVADWAELAVRTVDAPEPPAVAAPSVEVLAGSGLRTRAGRAGSDIRYALFADGDESVTARVAVPDGWSLERWDALTGEITRVEAQRQFEPGELRMLVLTERSDAPIAAPATTWGDGQALEWTLQLGDEIGAADVERGWQHRDPTWIGVGRYLATLTPESTVDHCLELPAVAGSAELLVDGRPVGRRGWAPYRFTIPAAMLAAGPVRLELRVSSAAANRYYAQTGLRAAPEPAGLLAAPLIRIPLTSSEA